MRDVSGSDVTPAAVKVSTCAPSVAGGGVRTRGGAFWGSLEWPCRAPDASETHSVFARVGDAGVTRVHDGQVERKQTVNKKRKSISKCISFLMQVISL